MKSAIILPIVPSILGMIIPMYKVMKVAKVK
jgi:hypothetical protein